MRKTVAMLFLCSVLCPAMAHADGVTLTVENDLFLGTDNSYTHGTELSWQGHDQDGNVVGYGLRERMYTPTDIGCITNQPGDRPWAGVTTAFRDWYYHSELGEMVKVDLEAGVLGPMSDNEQMQKSIHKIVGSARPKGWGNQIPDEPALNLTMDRRQLGICLAGDPNGFSLHDEFLYGGTAGTTFDNLKAGDEVRAGWNVPPSWPLGIEPKLHRRLLDSFGVYVLAGGDGMLVLHNATLGHSFFRRADPMWDRDVDTGVYEYWLGGGICLGNFSLKYMEQWRSEEFKGEPEATHGWGMVTLGFGATL